MFGPRSVLVGCFPRTDRTFSIRSMRQSKKSAKWIQSENSLCPQGDRGCGWGFCCPRGGLELRQDMWVGCRQRERAFLRAGAGHAKAWRLECVRHFQGKRLGSFRDDGVWGSWTASRLRVHQRGTTSWSKRKITRLFLLYSPCCLRHVQQVPLFLALCFCEQLEEVRAAEGDPFLCAFVWSPWSFSSY